MPENIIHCPQCQRQLRVPEEMVGRLVKCPTCSTQFTVSASGQPQPTAAPVPVEEPPAPRRREPEYDDPRYEERRPRRREPEYDDYDRAVRPATASLVAPPAICLLIAGILGIVVNAFQMAMPLFMKPEDMIKPDTPPFMQELLKSSTGAQAVIGGLIFATVSILVVFAAIQMLRMRTWGFALAGSIIAMINIGNCCCLLGLPFGIWSIIILSRQDVKSAFE